MAARVKNVRLCLLKMQGLPVDQIMSSVVPINVLHCLGQRIAAGGCQLQLRVVRPGRRVLVAVDVSIWGSLRSLQRADISRALTKFNRQIFQSKTPSTVTLCRINKVISTFQDGNLYYSDSMRYASLINAFFYRKTAYKKSLSGLREAYSGKEVPTFNAIHQSTSFPSASLQPTELLFPLAYGTTVAIATKSSSSGRCFIMSSPPGIKMMTVITLSYENAAYHASSRRTQNMHRSALKHYTVVLATMWGFRTLSYPAWPKPSATLRDFFTLQVFFLSTMCLILYRVGKTAVLDVTDLAFNALKSAEKSRAR